MGDAQCAHTLWTGAKHSQPRMTCLPHLLRRNILEMCGNFDVVTDLELINSKINIGQSKTI